MPFSDRELLARLIMCEAEGEGDNGLRAVAGVVMNRTTTPYGEYSRVSEGGNMRNIVFQPKQFECAEDENSRNLYNMRPEQIHYDIADWAIAGNRIPTVGKSLWFYNPFSPDCRPRFPEKSGEFVVRIANHCFYNPNEYYKET